MNSLDLSRLNRYMNQIEVKLGSREMDRVLPVLELVKAELVAKKKVLYGGAAQNGYLPGNLQFYNYSKDIPDYDVYSYDAKGFAQSVADKLHALKLKDVELKCALHPGTYKLFWDGTSVLDVTNVSKSDETRLRRLAYKTKDGLLLCPLNLLKANGYLELTLPDSAGFRWKKVAERVGLLEKAWSKNSTVDNKTPKSKLNVNELAIAIAQANNLPIAGRAAVFYHTQTNASSDPVFEALSMNPKKDLGLFKSLARQTRTVAPSKDSTFGPVVWTLVDSADNKPLVRLHDASHMCVATDPVNPAYVNLFYLLYTEYFRAYVTAQRGRTPTVRALLNVLSETKFGVSCFGTAPTMREMRSQKSRYAYFPGKSKK